MTKFLSPDWIAAANDLVKDLDPGPPSSVKIEVSAVPDQPEGHITYYMTLGPQCGFTMEGDTPTDTVLSLSYETAREIAMGTLNPTSAFLAGQLTVSGDVGGLVNQAEDLNRMSEAITGLSADTEY